MAITERIKHLTKSVPGQLEIEAELFIDENVFRRIINRERDRANRTGEIFSVVSFILPTNHARSNTIKGLATRLASGVRSIDAVGWLDSQHIGVLLPETNTTPMLQASNYLHNDHARCDDQSTQIHCQ